MTRDRLAELRTKMADSQRGARVGGDRSPSSNRLDDAHVQINLNQNGFTSNGSGQGPALTMFFQKVESIEAGIIQIESSVQELDRVHQRVLSSPESDEKTKAQLEDIMNDIKRMALAVRSKLKQLQADLDANNNGSGPPSAEERMKRMQESRLTKRLVEIMAEYSRIQIDYREKCKARIQRQLEVTGRITSNEELEEMLESGNEKVFTQDVVLDTRQARQMLADIEARHEDIIKLEKSIKELHDLFVEMSLLVDQQGEMVDRIEYQVSRTADHVEAAKEETRKAVELQCSARKKKILIGICLVVTLIILVSSLVGGLIPSGGSK